MKSFNEVNTVLQSTPIVNVNQMIKSISDYFIWQFKNGKKAKDISAIMLWGAPGVGKSESVYQISKILEGETGKKVYINDVRLSLYNPVDLRGIPSPNKDHTEAIWLRPEVFKFDDSEDVINILFLDELSTCSSSVQACAYQITLDRRIGEHKLPDNVLVIAAGNRKQDQSISIQMPKALANRMIHFDICSEVKDWRNWAYENNIDEKIIGFLAYKPEYLENGMESKNDLAYATPRSWAKASDILNTLGDTESGRLLISGTIGMGIATEFFHFCDCVDKLPNLDKIFSGKHKDIPKDSDILYTLVTAMSARARDCIEKGESITHAIRYAMNLPLDFSLLLHENVAAILSKKDPLKMFEDSDYMLWTEKLSENI